MKTPIKDALHVVAALLLTGGMAYAMQSPTPAKVQTKPTAQVQQKSSPHVEEAVAKMPTPQEQPKAVTWQDNPNHCDQSTQYISQDAPFTCIDKPAQTAPTASSGVVGSGDCAAEIAKYDWNYSVALAVATAESGLNPNQLNDNPATGDYSVGCFQINLYGANALHRPSEAWLKVAANNVSYAYQIYVGNGYSFLGQWGTCRTVSCY